MYAKHPEIARRWSAEYPDQKGLPKRVGTVGGLMRRKMKGMKPVGDLIGG